jgi:hypothetical protein
MLNFFSPNLWITCHYSNFSHYAAVFFKRLISFFLLRKNLLNLIRNTHFINVFCITEKIILGIFKKRAVWFKSFANWLENTSSIRNCIISFQCVSVSPKKFPLSLTHWNRKPRKTFQSHTNSLLFFQIFATYSMHEIKKVCLSCFKAILMHNWIPLTLIFLLLWIYAWNKIQLKFKKFNFFLLGWRWGWGKVCWRKLQKIYWKIHLFINFHNNYTK